MIFKKPKKLGKSDVIRAINEIEYVISLLKNDTEDDENAIELKIAEIGAIVTVCFEKNGLYSITIDRLENKKNDDCPKMYFL
jgi:hypothetical protein